MKQLVLLLPLILLPAQALADRHDRHHRHGHFDRHDSRFFRAAPRAYYYPSYYPIYSGYYTQPSYQHVSQTVVVQQPVESVVRTASTAEGRYCREYTRTIYVGGRAQEGYGTACMQPDGAWEMMD